MKKIMLNDVLNLNEKQLENTRIRFNIGNNSANPLQEFLEDPDNLVKWSFHNKSYKVGQIIIGLLKIGYDDYILLSIATITKKLTKPNKLGIYYEYEEMKDKKAFFTRIVINYHNKVQQMLRLGSKVMNELVISRILENNFDGFEFKGYENVCLSFNELKIIIEGKNVGYKNALRNQKAVYVLTDNKTGKLYIGSTTSKNGMLLDRWSSYIKTYHGGNVKLKELFSEKGEKYFKNNFQFTIIENYNLKQNDDYVIQRENYWKEVFSSRNHGYNSN